MGRDVEKKTRGRSGYTQTPHSGCPLSSCPLESHSMLSPQLLPPKLTLAPGHLMCLFSSILQHPNPAFPRMQQKEWLKGILLGFVTERKSLLLQQAFVFLILTNFSAVYVNYHLFPLSQLPRLSFYLGQLAFSEPQWELGRHRRGQDINILFHEIF